MAISTAQKVVDIAMKYLGCEQGSAKQKQLIRIFNTVKPHGYTASWTDPWCAEAWSAWQIEAGNTAKDVPLSANCKQIIEDAKKLGIWKEKDGTVPEIGWGILYDWDDSGKGENTGAADHIGLIYAVDKKWIYVIEGNKGTASVCGKRTVQIDGKFIRGFVAPKYKKETYKPSGPYPGKLPTGTVKKGSTGTDVKRLKAFLNWYQNAKLNPKNGNAKEKTDAAIKKFEKKNGIVQDGIFGPQCLKKAQEIVAEYNPFYDKATKIGHACCNEKGGLHGGKPGDQTGHEVQISYWSKGYGWLKVYRHKDPATRLKIAQYVMDACENNNIGYNVDKPERYAAWDAAEKNGHDIKGIKTKGDTTCTQLVSMVLRAVGTPKKYAPRFCDVAVAERVLPKNPDLIELKGKAYTTIPDNLEPGDMLLSSEHMAVVVKTPRAKGVA